MACGGFGGRAGGGLSDGAKMSWLALATLTAPAFAGLPLAKNLAATLAGIASDPA